MLLYQIVSSEIPIVATNDSVDYVNSLFFASKHTQLPVVENGSYKGLIEASNMPQYEGDPEEINTLMYDGLRFAINHHAHPYDALRMMHQNGLDILPVLNDEYEYVGAISQERLWQYIVELINIEVVGGIILLEMEPRNYSLAQIARICESEQVLILAAHAKTNPATSKLEVTLKTNSSDLSAVVQAFERFEYTVVDTFGDQKIENDISDRYRLLMNYINM